MTYYCSECVVSWWPYQAQAGCCPVCGGGTVRRQEPASPDADERFRQARDRVRKAEESAQRHADFEEYYAAREARRTGAQVEQPTDSYAVHELLSRMADDTAEEAR